jgi:hypothetical protein
MSRASVAEDVVVLSPTDLGHQTGGLFLSEKLQKVMAVTDVLALFWQGWHAWRGVIAMRIAVILALAFAITTGTALTAAFAFGLIPLGSIYWHRFLRVSARPDKRPPVGAIFCRRGSTVLLFLWVAKKAPTGETTLRHYR